MFKKATGEQKVEYLTEEMKVPKIIFPMRTLAIMHFIVETVPNEVGWLGYVETRQDGALVVQDIYIPGQHANGGTCEMDEGESLTKVCEQVINEGKDPGNIKFWCHSHGAGGTFPSPQDKTQSLALMKDLGDYLIRGICNKSCEMSVAYFDNINKRIVENVQWYIDAGIDHDAIKEKYGAIIKENVKEFQYHSQHTGVRQEWPQEEYDWQKNAHNYGRKPGQNEQKFIENQVKAHNIKEQFRRNADRKTKFNLVNKTEALY